MTWKCIDIDCMWCMNNKLRRKDTRGELILILQRIFIANLKYHFPQDVYNRINSKSVVYTCPEISVHGRKWRILIFFWFFFFHSEQVLDTVIVPLTLSVLSAQGPGVRYLFSLSKNPSPEGEQVLAHLLCITFSKCGGGPSSSSGSQSLTCFWVQNFAWTPAGALSSAQVWSKICLQHMR